MALPDALEERCVAPGRVDSVGVRQAHSCRKHTLQLPQDQQATAARHPPVPVPLPLPLLPPPLPPPPHQGHHHAFEQGVMQHARPGTSSNRVLVVQRQSLAQHVDQQVRPAGSGFLMLRLLLNLNLCVEG
jgi:hypothetical protein